MTDDDYLRRLFGTREDFRQQMARARAELNAMPEPRRARILARLKAKIVFIGERGLELKNLPPGGIVPPKN